MRCTEIVIIFSCCGHDLSFISKNFALFIFAGANYRGFFSSPPHFILEFNVITFQCKCKIIVRENVEKLKWRTLWFRMREKKCVFFLEVRIWTIYVIRLVIGSWIYLKDFRMVITALQALNYNFAHRTLNQATKNEMNLSIEWWKVDDNGS